MGGRGSSSASGKSGGGVRISYDSSPEAMRKFFADGYRKYGPNATLTWGGATDEQRSRIARAKNLAAGDVFGFDADISNTWLSDSTMPKVKRLNFGYGVHVFVSENPTDEEIRGAAALVRARGGRRPR